MALNQDQWAEIAQLTDRLRALGCAVCIFTPDDVESAAEADEAEITPEQATQWLSSNRSRFEGILSTRGNEYISDMLPDLAEA